MGDGARRKVLPLARREPDGVREEASRRHQAGILVNLEVLLAESLAHRLALLLLFGKVRLDGEVVLPSEVAAPFEQFACARERESRRHREAETRAIELRERARLVQHTLRRDLAIRPVVHQRRAIHAWTPTSSAALKQASTESGHAEV